MTKVICVKVSKGGVGKTTISSNLGYVLAQKEKKVLLIDMDSQANLTKAFLKNIDEDKLTSSNLLGDDEFDFYTSIYNISENLDLISADIGLHEVAKYLESVGNYYRALAKRIKNLDYDYVVLDLSPGVADTLTEIALIASDLLVAPMHFDTDSLSGLVLTINDISRLSEASLLEKDLKYLVVPNRWDKRFEKDNKAIIDMVYENLDAEFIAEPIRENSHIKKARMYCVSAIEYESAPIRKYEHKRATEDFEKLAQKVEKLLE